MKKMRHASIGTLVAVATAGLAGCIVERTVTDGGNVIYQDTVITSPFETTGQEESQVLQTEQALGM